MYHQWHYEDWDQHWMPESCLVEAELNKLSGSDFRVRTVWYDDCKAPWIVCRHTEAKEPWDTLLSVSITTPPLQLPVPNLPHSLDPRPSPSRHATIPLRPRHPPRRIHRRRKLRGLHPRYNNGFHPLVLQTRRVVPRIHPHPRRGSHNRRRGRARICGWEPLLTYTVVERRLRQRYPRPYCVRQDVLPRRFCRRWTVGDERLDACCWVGCV